MSTQARKHVCTRICMHACMHGCVCMKRAGFARSGWRGPSGEGLLSKARLAQGWRGGCSAKGALSVTEEADPPPLCITVGIKHISVSVTCSSPPLAHQPLLTSSRSLDFAPSGVQVLPRQSQPPHGRGTCECECACDSAGPCPMWGSVCAYEWKREVCIQGHRCALCCPDLWL